MDLGRIRAGYLVAFLLLALAVVLPTVVRFLSHGDGPTVTIESPDGRTRSLTLSDLKRLPSITHRGSYQDQYDNWRDEGLYVGVPLTAIFGEEADYASVRVIATDGYEITIEREQVESAEYPMVLAYAFDGREVPGWTDGFRIAVLPEDGAVSNEEYEAVSAGSYWVKNVARMVLLATPRNSVG